MGKKGDKKKRLHIGVLFGTLDDMSQFVLWGGIDEYAKLNDIHLTAYFGAYRAKSRDLASHYSHYETCLESIANSETLDGLILFSGYITTNMSVETYKEYLGRLPKELPLVSVSFQLPGIPSVMIDNKAGMYSLVEHLIKQHDKKKIAFIRGPLGHFEAEERLQGYRAALEANGIEFDRRYVLPGDFTTDSGRCAAIELLDNRKLQFDAIVGSNDGMASTAMDELISRGYRVHSDIAVTGFDDDIIAIRANPTLSTMRQDFAVLGMMGAGVLCDIIAGKPVQDVYHMTPFFVPRQSCGCFERDLLSRDSEHFDEIADPEVSSLTSFAQHKIAPLLAPYAPERKVREWVTILAGIMKEKPFSRGMLLHYIFVILTEYRQHSSKLKVWCDALLALREGALRYEDEIADLSSLLSALFFAMMMVQDVRFLQKQTQDYDLYDLRALISKVTSALILSFDTDLLADAMMESLPSIFINTALVCLYHTPIDGDDPDADRSLETILGFDGTDKFVVTQTSRGVLRPHDYSAIDEFDFDRRRRTLFFLPIFFLEKELGILILPYDDRIPVDAYETLRIDISTAVQGAGLVSKIQAMSTVDELTGVFNRRGFFHYAASSLHRLCREQEVEPVTPIVLFIDMDNLKGINDTYGHRDGDEAIAAFAHILKAVTRKVDVVGRMGGDEFVVFSSVKSPENVGQLTARIQEKLAQYNAKKLHPFDIGCSIGCAALDALTMDALESAIAAADNLLYEEKAAKKKISKF